MEGKEFKKWRVRRRKREEEGRIGLHFVQVKAVVRTQMNVGENRNMWRKKILRRSKNIKPLHWLRKRRMITSDSDKDLHYHFFINSKFRFNLIISSSKSHKVILIIISNKLFYYLKIFLLALFLLFMRFESRVTHYLKGPPGKILVRPGWVTALQKE